MYYKIKCKTCGDILESRVPVKDEIKCKCGNVSLYSDYIAYNHINLLPKEECYEVLSTESMSIDEVKEILELRDNHKKVYDNKIKCLNCNEIIESKYINDFKRCSCGKVAVDGGHVYLKRVGEENKDYIELSSVIEENI